ncbi:MAG: hypothetical protein ACI37Z_09215 [Candidatus Gastranaerophilaceae bacterium]
MNNTFKIFITVVFLLIVLFFWLFSRIKIEGLQKISKTSKEVSKIDGNDLTKNFKKQDDKEALKKIIKNLPREAVKDLNKEINEICPDKRKGRYGSFDASTNKISIKLNDHAKYILVHELGHGVDTIAFNINGIEINQSSLANEIKRNEEFAKTYHKELNKFFTEYKKSKGHDHVWATYTQEVNPSEIFATYYVLKIFGKSDTDFAEIMAKNMPETIKKINELIKENRKLPENQRKGVDKEFYPNGQLKRVKSTNKGVAYIDGYLEDGKKAYQYQYFSDGTEHRFIDEYDENGNKTNTKFIKIGLDRVYTTPMNRR